MNDLDCTFIDNSITPTYFLLSSTVLIYKLDLPDDWTNASINATILQGGVSFAYSKDGNEFTGILPIGIG